MFVMLYMEDGVLFLYDANPVAYREELFLYKMAC